ncbi:hypothetical protein AKJ29_17180 [Aliiroseovarius crassostreae]|uniref:Glycosyl transferase family 2 n=1 Tax=Aliiroseovarius crassostreae TaxID=154981 RepID=A0A0N8IBX9_9RHOB|nr:hypothetical protein AKJ29_17180 [Aliiroseovarius crassostreae]
MSTVREPLPLVLAFACHHLSLGAHQVHLYFDNPQDPAADLLETLDGVEVTRCDPTHWARLNNGTVPPLQTGRQALNANDAKHRSKADLILHIDADEFLWAPDDAMAQDFSFQTPWLKIPNLERCWGPVHHPAQTYGLFGGMLRGAIKDRDLARDIYGASNRFMSGGMGGHSSGKTLTPRKGDGFIAIHKAKTKRGGDVLPHETAQHLRILHFDGITPLHWAYKSLKYVERTNHWNMLLNNARKCNVMAINGAEDPLAEALLIYDELFCLNGWQARQLSKRGKLFEMAIDPLASIAKIAPGLGVDLTTSGFDASLRTEAKTLAKRIRERNL